MAHDPEAFLGTASYYVVGRPPYSEELRPTLISGLDLDGTGRLLDVGCGPGVLTVLLAPAFEEAIGLDPDDGMLREGQRQAERHDVENIRWIKGVAEEIPTLGIGPCRLVTFGQSFHRTQQHLVAEAVYDLLEPGGVIALIAHAVEEGQAIPPGTGHPAIPHTEIRELIDHYLGDRSPLRHLQPFERFAESLSRTRFGVPSLAVAPGRPDLVRDVDSVVAGCFSMSYAAPRLFGDQRDAFERDLRALLLRHSPSGLFWDWPGDTEIVFARK